MTIIESGNLSHGKPTLVIAHPSDELYGADKVLLEIVSALRSRYSIEVWLPDDVEYPERLLSRRLDEVQIDVHFYPLPVIRRKDLNIRGLLKLFRRFLQIRNVIIKKNPDIIYLNTTSLSLMLFHTRSLCLVSVLHVHEFLGDISGRVLMTIAGTATKVIAVSQSIANDFTQRMKRKTTVIHNGFSISASQTKQDNSEELVFLFASRWNFWKGHKEFLRLWDLVPTTPGTLRILGGPPVAGQAIDVPAIVSQLKHLSSVEIVGESRFMQSEIEKADIVVVPSTRPDPLPTIAIEALAAGRPVLATAAGGLPEIIGNDCGWVVPIGASDKEWIATLESISPTEVRAKSAGCRTRYEAKFSRERFESDIRKALDDLRPLRTPIA